MGHRDDYDERYVDHPLDDCLDREGRMCRYHNYEYYESEYEYGNQTNIEFYDKSQEYESYWQEQERQEREASKRTAYEEYWHRKRLGIDDEVYDSPAAEASSKSQASVIDYTTAAPISKAQRRKLMEAQVAKNFEKGRKKALKRSKPVGCFGWTVVILGLVLGSFALL